jgi:cell division protein FtsB
MKMLEQKRHSSMIELISIKCFLKDYNASNFNYSIYRSNYLLIQLDHAYEEFSHWKSREVVLEKELEELRIEANDHKQFLNRLRSDPDFQDAVARKELGLR